MTKNNIAVNTNGGNWEDDVLNRKSIADDFTNILLSLPTPYVVSINAEYGMGKSFFIERWAEDLKKNGRTVLNFNAWENDFSDDPLMSFVVDLQEQFEDIGFKKSSSTMKGIVESVGWIAEKLDWDYNAYDGQNYPILYLKELLDIGTKYEGS